MKTTTIFNLNLVISNYKSLIKEIDTIIKKGKKRFLVTINSIMLYQYFINKEFKTVLQKADIIITDGIGVKIFSNWFGEKVTYIPGIDLLNDILEASDINKYKLFLLGSKESTIKKAAENIKKEYPKIRITGIHSGYFNSNDEPEIIKSINKSSPEILLIGMGSVKQEKWIAKNINKLKANLIMGVGGSFDIISGNKKRTPLWIRKLYLEWLYRSLFPPTRILNLFKLMVLTIIILSIKFKIIRKGEDYANL